MARTHQEYFDDASAVFSGQVVDIDKLEEDDYELTFSVSQYWKGLSENDRFVTARLSSFDGGLCGFPFQESEEYLTYARESSGELAVGGCIGTRPMADADNALAVLGAGAVPQGSVTFVDPDPLDGAAGTPLNAPGPDWALVFIVAAIGILSAGIAFVIIKKPRL